MKSKSVLIFAAIAAVLLLLFSRQSTGAAAPIGAGTLPVTGNPLANLANTLRQSLSGLASTGPPATTPPGTAYGVIGGQQGPPAPDLIDPLTGDLYSDEPWYSNTAAGVTIGEGDPLALYLNSADPLAGVNA
jgi:hypothetical protein